MRYLSKVKLYFDFIVWWHKKGTIQFPRHKWKWLDLLHKLCKKNYGNVEYSQISRHTEILASKNKWSHPEIYASLSLNCETVVSNIPGNKRREVHHHESILRLYTWPKFYTNSRTTWIVWNDTEVDYTLCMGHSWQHKRQGKSNYFKFI